MRLRPPMLTVIKLHFADLKLSATHMNNEFFCLDPKSLDTKVNPGAEKSPRKNLLDSRTAKRKEQCSKLLHRTTKPRLSEIT
jgi:hypothetical protein